MNNLEVREWNILPTDRKENTWFLRKLLDAYRGREDVNIEFESGTYHFYPDYARETLLFISNHDEDTIKKAAFDLSDYKKLKLKGNNSHFIFHTDMIPFLLNRCEDIVIEGITVDLARAGHSQGIIRYADEKRIDLEIDQKKYPYFIKHRRLYFTGENYCHELNRWMELDQERLEPVYGNVDRSFNMPDAGETAVWEEKEPGLLCVRLPEEGQFFDAGSRVSNPVIFRHHPRNCPAIYLENCVRIYLRDVTVYHAAGMGFIACRSENIQLERFNVMLNPGRKEVFTTEADAIQMIGCRGKLLVKDCLLENQLDDGINIHGVYAQIVEMLPDNRILIKLVHHQHKGMPVLKSGESFRVLDGDSMLPVCSQKAISAEILNREFLIIGTDGNQEQLKPGQVIENMDWIPDVEITGCKLRNNRARGVLVTAGGNIRIHKNYFHNSGAAILIEGDSKDWFESGALNRLEISENTFDNCAYIPAWGKAPIQVSPSAKKLEEGSYYHKYMSITHNVFRCFDRRLLWIKNIEQVIFTDNRVEYTKAYKPIFGDRFVMEHVGEFTLQDTEPEI